MINNPIDGFRSWFQSVEYNPRTLETKTRDGVFPSRWLDMDGRVFIEMWTQRAGVSITWSELYDNSWAKCPKLQADYIGLSDISKSAILALATFPLHEMTHHVDLLTTPFGAQFHGNCFLEYARFESHAASDIITLWRELKTPIARSVLATPDGWTAGFANESHQRIATRVAKSLRPRLEFFETSKGSRHVPCVPGWLVDGDWHKSLSLFDFELSLVTAGEHGYTFAMGSDSYASAFAILEARAMANALSWIIFSINDQEKAVRECERFVNVFYDRSITHPNYTLLLDLFTRVMSSGREATFHGMLPCLDSDKLLRVLGTLSACCWYALHATPGTDNPNDGSPAIRFVRALRQLEEDAVMSPPPSKEPMAIIKGFFERIDKKGLGQGGMASVANAADWLEHLLEINDRIVQDPEMRSHFAMVLSAVRWHLMNRNDYGTPPGAVSGGRPIPGPKLQSSDELNRLLLDFKAGDSVRKWNLLREQVLHRFPMPATREALENRFRRSILSGFCMNCLSSFELGLPAFTRGFETNCPVCGANCQLSPEDAIDFGSDQHSI